MTQRPHDLCDPIKVVDPQRVLTGLVDAVEFEQLVKALGDGSAGPGEIVCQYA